MRMPLKNKKESYNKRKENPMKNLKLMKQIPKKIKFIKK